MPMNAGIDPEGDAGYLLYGDALFRKHRKKGWAYVGSPVPALEAPVADTHAHLAMLSWASISYVRCATRPRAMNANAHIATWTYGAPRRCAYCPRYSRPRVAM